MRMKELQNEYLSGHIDKKLYWTIMREKYTHVLPEIMEVLCDHKDCNTIRISADGVVLEKHSGVKMFFDFRESFSRAEIDLLNETDPERDDIRIISELISRVNAKTVLDIGANVGMFSLELYQEHPNLEYHLFEPIPTTYEKLLRTIEMNEVEEDKFQLINSGVSNTKGSFKFYLPGESEAASLMPVEDPFYRKNSDEYGHYTGSSDMIEVDCKVTTVDDYVRENEVKSVDFIKVDVEGNEKFVLEGARETLSSYRPLVYCELLRKHSKRFGYHPNDVIEYMKQFGYRCRTVRDGVLVDVGLIDDQTKETNFIFCLEK